MTTELNPHTYEPPRIEKTFTADDLAREVHYAGGASEPDIAGD